MGQADVRPFSEACMGKVILPNRGIPFKAERWCHGMDSGQVPFWSEPQRAVAVEFLVSDFSWRGERKERLPDSDFLDQLAQSFPLDRPQIQEFHSEDLPADPPNDSMVNVDAPAIAW
jgi:hypothetical protein